MCSNSEVNPLLFFLALDRAVSLLIEFRQLVTEPTQVTRSSKTLIDLPFVSHPETFEKADCADMLNSEHSMIYDVYCKEGEKRLAKIKSIRSFNKCDVEELDFRFGEFAMECDGHF